MDREVCKSRRRVTTITYAAVGLLAVYVSWGTWISPPAAKYTTVPLHAQSVKVSGIKPL